MLKLRPYQETLVHNTLQSLLAGNRNTLNVASTGAGKTICFIKICEQLYPTLKEDEAVFILSHLSLLTDQTEAKFNKFSPINVGIMQASRIPSREPVIISTMQSCSRPEKVEAYMKRSGKKPRYIIVDESHRRFSDSYSSIFNMFPDAQIVDFTATPFKNKRLATGFYDCIAFQISMKELIEQKYLVPPVLKQIKMESTNVNVKCATVLRLYQEHEMGKAAIAFMKSKDECHLLAAVLHANGISAAVVTDDVTGDKRDEIFKRYDAGEIDFLISVSVLEAGFDSPRVEAIFMFDTESPVAYLQRIGRGLRPWDSLSVKPEHPKQDCRVYFCGDTPTIESGEIEKLHEKVVNPKKREECETISEEMEWLDDHDMKDTDDYVSAASINRVCKLAEKLNMNTLARLINERKMPEKYLGKYADVIDNFKTTTQGKREASFKQKELIRKMKLIDNVNLQLLSKNEASFLIETAIGKKKAPDKWTISEGPHKGKAIWQTPHAYRSWVVKNRPTSSVGKLIASWQNRTNA